MKRHRCDDLNCPDCHPEHWQPKDDDPHTIVWPYAALLLLALVVLAFVYVSGPGP